MNRKHLFGYALAVAFCGTQASAEELTGTLKNIKETGAITLGYRELLDSIFLPGRQPEADRICDGYLLQDRRRREEGAQTR